MNTFTDRHGTTGNPEIDKLLNRAMDIHEAAGTDVRCPTCNAPAGVFCVVPGSPNTREQYRTAAHSERIALTSEKPA